MGPDGAANIIFRNELAEAAEDPAGYAGFWEAFGAVLKEGLYEDFENRDRLLGLARFRSTEVDGWTSLADYVSRMKQNQTVIYVMVADSIEAARVSPQIEGFKARGLEVLLLGDPIDGFWTMMTPDWGGKPIRAVGRIGDDELAAFPKLAEADAATDGDDTTKDATAADGTLDGAALADLIARALGDKVRGVRPSARLVDSPACLAAGAGERQSCAARRLGGGGIDVGQHRGTQLVGIELRPVVPGKSVFDRLGELAADDHDGPLAHGAAP